MKYAAAILLLPLSACASRGPAESSFQVVREAAPPPVVIIRRDPLPPVVSDRVAKADLQEAQTHLAEADRYVAWDKSKPHIVDRLGPLASAVSAAAKKVRADNAVRRVSLRDDAELRAATAALKNYIDTKGD